jgi:hypothetical protein
MNERPSPISESEIEKALPEDAYDISDETKMQLQAMLRDLRKKQFASELSQSELFSFKVISKMEKDNWKTAKPLTSQEKDEFDALCLNMANGDLDEAGMKSFFELQEKDLGHKRLGN